MYGHATNFNVGPWDDKAQWPTWRWSKKFKLPK